MALYEAKNSGRGKIEFYSPILQVELNTRLQLEEGLRCAIKNNELKLHFQPQVNNFGLMSGAEVLLRWFHPELGNVSPDVFIPIAEETGLIHSIGDWVFAESCRHLSQWLHQGIAFRGHLSINVCPWQFASHDFVERLIQHIEFYQIEPRFLVIEVTETAILQDLDHTIEKLKQLRSYGIRIALDDFGTGYSSLAHLKYLPLDIVKIDKAFIHEMEKDCDHCLVESIISIGKLMNLEVVAEGVETQYHFNRLVDLGCDVLQGYFFRRPLSDNHFLEWIYQRNIVLCEN